MKFIAHRGNINEKKPEKENHPDYILEAMQLGYDVEVDVWYENDKFVLGHNNPEYEIDYNFLLNQSLWCHAKNIEALYAMRALKAHCFWHQEDDVSLTSNGFLWTYPGKPLYGLSICVKPELSQYSKNDLLYTKMKPY